MRPTLREIAERLNEDGFGLLAADGGMRPRSSES
jgi:hypothetical protein